MKRASFPLLAALVLWTLTVGLCCYTLGWCDGALGLRLFGMIVGRGG